MIKSKSALRILTCFLFFLFCAGFSAAEDVIAFRAGRIITVTQGTVEDGILLIQGGKIADVGGKTAIPPGAKVIDASKYTIMPGLIDAFTNLGTTEIESLGGDSDEATSPVTPHLRIVDAFNPENRFIPIARRSGITAALTAPGEGNLLSGQSALIFLSGETIEDMVLAFPVAVHGSLGELPKLRYGAKGLTPSTRMGAAALLRQTLIDAGAYGKKIRDYEEKLKEYRSRTGEAAGGAEKKEEKKDEDLPDEPIPPPVDFKLSALLPLLKGEMPLIVRANRVDDILTALRIADEFGLKIILNHGAEAYKLAGKLAEKKIPVLVGPLSDYFQRLETRDALFTNAVRLHKAGVKIAFQTGSVQNVSDLLYQAEKAVSYGLPYDEALKALTLYPAQIFGVDEMLGSIEKGKSASFVAFEGEPLENLSRVKMVVIRGRVFESE